MQNFDIKIWAMRMGHEFATKNRIWVYSVSFLFRLQYDRARSRQPADNGHKRRKNNNVNDTNSYEQQQHIYTATNKFSHFAERNEEQDKSTPKCTAENG